MLKFNEKKCVCETEGVIIEKRWDGDDGLLLFNIL